MVQRERVVEVDDGEEEREELAQGHDQGHAQRRALSCQDEHGADTNISGAASRNGQHLCIISGTRRFVVIYYICLIKYVLLLSKHKHYTFFY